MNEFLTDHRGWEFRQDHDLKPSKMYYTHTHDTYELYFCPHKVAQTSVINGVEYSYEYPCAILSSPYTIHSMSCRDLSVKRFERYVFYFGETLFDTFGSLIPQALRGRDVGFLFALTEGQGAQLKRLLDTCCAEDPQVERELAFVLFLNRLLQFCPPENAVRVGTSSFYIRDVLRYVSETEREPADTGALAKRFAVSRSKLERDFKRFTGMTVHGYADICRLNLAKYLLREQKDLSVRAVAIRCGFENETYFFPFFKKGTGMTPSEFRKASGKTLFAGSDPNETDRPCGCK